MFKLRCDYHVHLSDDEPEAACTPRSESTLKVSQIQPYCSCHESLFVPADS